MELKKVMHAELVCALTPYTAFHLLVIHFCPTWNSLCAAHSLHPNTTALSCLLIFNENICSSLFIAIVCVCMTECRRRVIYFITYTQFYITTIVDGGDGVYFVCVPEFIIIYVCILWLISKSLFSRSFFFLPRFYICVLIVYRSGCFTFVPLVSFSLFLSDYTPREHHSALEFLHYLLCHIAWLFRQ